MATDVSVPSSSGHGVKLVASPMVFIQPKLSSICAAAATWPVDITDKTGRPTVGALAGLTAADGATVISDYFEPLAFGTKTLSRDGVHRVDQVLLIEPIEGIPDTTVDQRSAIALVASQHGQFTVFAWSSIREMVHAYRLEAATI